MTLASRFAVLPDDVDEPVAKKGGSGSGGGGGDKVKKNKGTEPKKDKDSGKKGGGGGNNANKKKGGSGDAGQKGKSLKSLAFGGSGGGDGKKKQPSNNQPTNDNATNNLNKSDGDVPSSSSLQNGAGYKAKARPTSAQWEEWQRRDEQLTDGMYESELAEALVQSKLDYNSELTRTKGKSKGKKKGVTVPFNEFDPAMLDAAKSDSVGNHMEDEGTLVEFYRAEAKKQFERQKCLEQQKDLLASRPKVYKHPHSKDRLKGQTTSEQDSAVETLRAQNELLKSELESYKMRLKKVHDIFQTAQDLKDKAKLIYQVEMLTKSQEELNGEVQRLSSELEQERSKARSAILECKRLMEVQSRRRTNTEGST